MQITPDQLTQRLRAIEARWIYFQETAARQAGKLKRHETWRHEYTSFPYLIGAPDDRLGARFKDVFINQFELSAHSKLRVLPINEEHEFMVKFTHLLEEYAVRTGGKPPEDVVNQARLPLTKYFEGGEPIASRLFREYLPQDAPFIVKYGRREFLDSMFRKGEIRICPASYYNDANHNFAVRDDEIHRTFFIPTFRERMKGIHHLMFRGHRIEFGDDDIVLPVEARDYFLFSLCDSIYYRLPTDFNADAALIIKDPNRFTQRVVSSFLARYPDWSPYCGRIVYYDPYRDFEKVRVHQMSKHFGYAYQREIRIVMKSNRVLKQALQPEFFNIGSMCDYAELIFVEN